MTRVFGKTLRDEAVKSLTFFALASAGLGLAVGYYPTFAENRGFIAKMVPIFVRGMVADVLRDEYVGYFVFQHFVKNLLFLSAAAAIFIGMGAVSKEVETGTIHVLLAKPVGRTRVLLEKAAALAVCVTAPIVAASLLGVALSAAIGEFVPWKKTLVASAHASLFALSLLSVTLLASVLFHEQIKAGAWAGVVFVAEIVLFLVDDTRRYSYFDYASYGSYRKIYVDGIFPWRDAAILAAVAVAALAASIAIFRRKDY